MNVKGRREALNEIRSDNDEYIVSRRSTVNNSASVKFPPHQGPVKSERAAPAGSRRVSPKINTASNQRESGTYDPLAAVPEDVRRRKTPKKIMRISPEKKKAMVKYIAVRAGIVLSMTLIFGLIVYSSFMNSLTSVKISDPGYKQIIIGNKNGDVYYRHYVSDIVYEGEIYVSMTEIAELCGLTISGDSERLRFICDNGEYVQFYIGTVHAEINGSYITMGEKSRGSYENVLIPFDFVQSYMDGISISKDDEKDILYLDIYRSENEDQAQESNDLSFTVVPPSVSGGISFEYLPEAVKDKVYDAISSMDPDISEP
ncbi:MAG: hypothetical protein E7623_05800 [Ruminococcaceae bacterium]|nr:hypothetical protein [Oscillospiraceae bacterium]